MCIDDFPRDEFNKTEINDFGDLVIWHDTFNNYASIEVGYFSPNKVDITGNIGGETFTVIVDLVEIIRSLKIPKEDVLRAYDEVGSNE